MVINCAHGPNVELSDEKPAISPDGPRTRKMSIAPPGSVVVLLPSINVTATRAGRCRSANAWRVSSLRRIALSVFYTSNQRFFQFVNPLQNILSFIKFKRKLQ